MEIKNIKSRYELNRSLGRNNYNINKIGRGDKKEILGLINKLPFNKNDYVVILLDGKGVELWEIFIVV